jgi:hypothetical protein
LIDGPGAFRNRPPDLRFKVVRVNEAMIIARENERTAGISELEFCQKLHDALNPRDSAKRLGGRFEARDATPPCGFHACHDALNADEPQPKDFSAAQAARSSEVRDRVTYALGRPSCRLDCGWAGGNEAMANGSKRPDLRGESAATNFCGAKSGLLRSLAD